MFPMILQVGLFMHGVIQGANPGIIVL